MNKASILRCAAVFLLNLLLISKAGAQDYSYAGSDLVPGTLAAFSVSSVEDDYDQQVQINERLLKVVFNTNGINPFHSLAYASSAWSVTLDLTIEAKDAQGNLLKQYDALLDLSDVKPQNYFIIDYAPLDAEVAEFEITVNSNPFTGLGAKTQTIRSHVQLDIYLEDKLGFGINTAGGGTIQPTALIVTPCSGAGSQISCATFSWSLPGNQHFSSYDLEVLKAEPYTDGNVEIDWNKAATIEVNTTQYTMTLAEGTGLYFWRVRPIGSFYKGGRKDYRNYGTWSAHVAQNNTASGYFTITTNSDGIEVPAYTGSNELNPSGTSSTVAGNHFYYNQFNDGLNWIYSKVLTEGSRQAESMTFADGLYQVRQTQTKLFTPYTDGSGNSVQQVIGAQTLYDYTGRPAMQSLPAPVGNDQLGYKEDFFENSTGAPFTAADFDESTTIFVPNISIDSTTPGTPFHYYSDENTLGIMKGFVPSAKQYPFIRTLYTKDGTGRAFKQSAPGANKKLKSTETEKGNITVLYGGVLQDELDIVFGNEAPVDTTTYKEVTVDQNNSISIKYVGKKGEVLATALWNTGASGMEDVGNEGTPQTISATLPPSVLASGEEVAKTATSIVVEEPNRQISLSYTLTPQSFSIPCGSTTSGDCDYHVEIEISCPNDPDNPAKNVLLSFDVAGGSTVTLPALSGATNILILAPDGTDNSGNFGTLVSNGEVNLSFGSYLLEKRVYVNNTNPATGIPYLDETVRQFERDAQAWTAANNCCGDMTADVDIGDYDCNTDQEAACEMTTEEIALELFEYVNMEQEYKSALANGGSDLLSNSYINFNSFVTFIRSKIEDQGTVDPDNCEFTWECFQEQAGKLRRNIAIFKEGGVPSVYDPFAIPETEGTLTYNTEFDFLREVQKCFQAQNGIPGLLGEYFANTDYTGIVRTNVDPFIDFSPSNINCNDINYQSIRWSGYLFVPETGDYTIYIQGGAYDVKLYIDGNLIINEVYYLYENNEEASTNIYLEENRAYEIIINRRISTCDCNPNLFCFPSYTTRMLWESTELAKEIIPAQYLQPLYQPGCTQYNNINIWSCDAANKINNNRTLDLELPCNPATGDENHQKTTAQNFLCVQTYFADDIFDDVAKTVINGTLSSPRSGLTIEEATAKVCECSNDYVDATAHPEVNMDVIQQEIINQCEAGCAEKAIQFETAIDEYVYQYNSTKETPAYYPGDPNWDDFGTLFPGQARECLITEMIDNCEIMCSMTETSALINQADFDIEEPFPTYDYDGVTYDNYFVFLESPVFQNIMQQEQLLLEQAMQWHPRFAKYESTGGYSDFGTTIGIHQEITGFFYSTIFKGMNAKEAVDMDGTIGTSTATYPLSLQSAAPVSNAAYHYYQRSYPFVYRTVTAGVINYKNAVAVATVIKDDGNFMVTREINVAIYCDGNTTSPEMHWSYAPTLPNTYFSIEPAGDYNPRQEIVTFFFDKAGAFYAVPNEEISTGGTIDAAEICGEKEVAVAFFDITGGATGDYFNLEITEGAGLSEYLNASPVFWNSDAITTATDAVAAINAGTASTGYWASNEDAAGTATGTVTIYTTTGSGKAPFDIQVNIPASSLTYTGPVLIAPCAISLNDLLAAGCYSNATDTESGNCPYGYTAVNLGTGTCEYCISWEQPQQEIIYPSPADNLSECEKAREQYVANQVGTLLGQCLADKIALLRSNYNNTCLDNIDDEFSFSYDNNVHHYTLYYYDRAGNLIQTVPPEGVRPLTTAEVAQVQQHRSDPVTYTAVYPSHELATRYKYNSLGQLTEQVLPDYDQNTKTSFYYNDLGQQVLTLDPTGRMIYSKYDRLGRVIETGKLSGFAMQTPSAGNVLEEARQNLNFPDSETGITKEEVIHIIYSRPDPAVQQETELRQRHLRNRISKVYTDEGAATYYSYDPHGNVEWIVQDLPEIGKKVVRYEYDLVSGNVKKVFYQEGTPEQFIHRYEYDADNRIVEVFTSADGVHWDKDAGYNYYTHGPLARVEIGQDRLQGADYVYTVEGHLKAINQPELTPTHDPGRDGDSGSEFVSDEFGMELGYFRGDYHRAGSLIGDENPLDPYGSALTSTNYTNLYNGNISYWISNIRDGNTGNAAHPLEAKMRSFRYDKLNRLRYVDFQKYQTASSGWNNISGYYDEEFTYDANGNIKTLLRYGSGSVMDDFEYQYRWEDNTLAHASKRPLSNRLYHVNDYTSTPTDNTDIEDQGTFSYAGDQATINASNNYGYDAMGNLTRDESEGIIEISWNLQNKVEYVKKQEGSNYYYLIFEYDALGNRIIKKKTETTTVATDMPDDLLIEDATFYIRDASGNIMAVYAKQYDGTTTDYVLKELPIYGSSRLGQYQPDLSIASISGYNDDYIKYSLTLTSTPTEMVKWTVPTDNGVDILDFSSPGSVTGSSFITSSGNVTNTAIELDGSDNELLIAFVEDGELKLYRGDGTAFTNMPASLPAEQGELAQPVIVKDPANADQYYVVYFPSGTDDYRQLQYVQVNTSTGAVVDNGTVNSFTLGRKLLVVTFADATSRIITYKNDGSNLLFYAIDVTDAGFSAPVYLGQAESSADPGDMALSPDGSRLAVAAGDELILFNMDISCGNISDPWTTTVSGLSALEFSENFIYCSGLTDTELFGVPVSIPSLKRIDLQTHAETYRIFFMSEEMQRTVEGKLLVKGTSHVAVINYPDADNINNISAEALTSLSASAMNYGLPQQTHHSETVLFEKEPVRLPENFNWIAATKGTSGKSGAPDISFKDGQVAVSNTSPETNKAVFKNIAVAENEHGEVQFKFYVTEHGNKVLVDADNNPITFYYNNSYDLHAGYDTKSITAKVPGNNNLYYLITGYSGGVFYHVIDMDMKEVASMNNALPNASYSTGRNMYALAVYNDLRAPGQPNKLYVAVQKDNAQETVNLYSYDITETGIVSEATVKNWTADHPYMVGVGEMHISPQGNELGVSIIEPDPFAWPEYPDLIKIERLPTTHDLNDIHFPDINTGVVAGDRGTMFRTENGGHTWEQVNTGTNKNIEAVHFTDTRTGYIAGEQEMVRKTTDGGQTWTDISPAGDTQGGQGGSTQQKATLREITFTDAQTGFISGDGGTMLRTVDGGQNWERLVTDVTADLASVAFKDAQEGFAAGTGGTMLRTADSGQTWEQQTTSATENINAVTFDTRQPDKGFALPGRQKMLRTENGGRNWQEQPVEHNIPLRDLAIGGADRTVAVGDMGMIMQSRDKGETWQQEQPVTENLHAVHITEIGVAYAAGERGTLVEIIPREVAEEQLKKLERRDGPLTPSQQEILQVDLKRINTGSGAKEQIVRYKEKEHATELRRGKDGNIYVNHVSPGTSFGTVTDGPVVVDGGTEGGSTDVTMTDAQMTQALPGTDGWQLTTQPLRHIHKIERFDLAPSTGALTYRDRLVIGHENISGDAPLTPARRVISFDYTENNSYIYYTQMAETLKTVSLMTQQSTGLLVYGNTEASNKNNVTSSTLSLSSGEMNYGMIWQPHRLYEDRCIPVPVPAGEGYYAERTINNKLYELTDHLGNVRVTFTDRRLVEAADAATGEPTAWMLSINSWADYYAFGSPMQGRTYSLGDYRYGFNGMEMTDEIKGTGNHYTALFWEMDPRLGRRWNLDPQPVAWESSYAVNRNNPFWVTDPLGNFGKNSDEKKREKAQKKFDKKVVKPLRELETELREEGLSNREIQAQVQEEADRLAEKYQNKKWLHWSIGVPEENNPAENSYKSGELTNFPHQQKVRIVAYQRAVQNVQINNNRPADGSMVNTGNTGLTVSEGSTVNIQFNPLLQPNSLDVTTVDPSGATSTIATTGGMISDTRNRQGVFIFNNTTAITNSNAGQIEYTVRNSNPVAASDNWQLRIQVTSPPVLNPIPLVVSNYPFP